MARTSWAMAAAAMVVPMVASAQTAATVQQDFEAATRLTDAQDWSAALAAWEALERRVASNPRNLSLVRLRKATVLLALDRRDEAATTAHAGLERIPTTDPSLRRDRYDAHIVLARIAKSALDYATAYEQFGAARALAADANQKLATWWGVVETGTFVDPVAALAVDRDYAALTEGLSISDDLRGQLLTTRAQLYLNLGRNEDARAMAREAVKALGGLTSRTELNDVAARSMAGLAALRIGDRNDARRYLALTGAGRSEKGRFAAPTQMVSPPCGGDAGLRPEDVAVIEFSVAADGSVLASAPVWASRQGDAALAFARAARDWAWTPEQLAKLPPFFRSRVRVEMRCSTAFARPSLSGYAHDALWRWLTSEGAAPTPLEGSAARLATTRQAQLAALDAGGKAASLDAVPLLYALATNTVTGREESNGWAERMTDILDTTDAPPLALLAANHLRWSTEDADRQHSKRYRAALRSALTDPDYAGDAEARGVIALMLSDAVPTGDRELARQYAVRVADDPALPDHHPLKVGALIRIASLAYQEDDVEAARAAFERTGMSAEQCALLDATPQMRRSNSSSSDFPREAVYWGMEGWTRVQYDIATDGDSQNARVVLAYPPFIFSESGKEVVDDAEFEASFRPGNALGCGGTILGVNFQMPS